MSDTLRQVFSSLLRDEHLPLRRGRSRYDTGLEYRVRRELAGLGRLVVARRADAQIPADDEAAWTLIDAVWSWPAAVSIIQTDRGQTDRGQA